MAFPHIPRYPTSQAPLVEVKRATLASGSWAACDAAGNPEQREPEGHTARAHKNNKYIYILLIIDISHIIYDEKIC